MNKLSILELVYKLNLELYKMVNNFPRAHKMVLGNKIITIANQVLEDINDASLLRGEEKGKKIDKADLELKKLLLFVRFSKDLSFTSYKKYEGIARRVVEIGKQIGGWKKWL